jgi:hypothetical protein
MKGCVEPLPLILPREQEIKVRGVHYKVGDTVWTPATTGGGNRKRKEVRCPCCNGGRNFFFGKWDMVCLKVKEIRIILKGTVPEVTYLLEEGGLRDAAHIFPTEAGAKRWAKAKAARDNADSQKDYDAERARIKRFIEKTKRSL